MRDSFGARLRRHREDRGVSVADIAEQTKIKASLLEGLERDDISQWPAGIFRRAYVRSYAAAIGFDPDVAVREFLELHPEPLEATAPPTPPSGLRGFFGSFRRRTTPPIPTPPQTGHGATATIGKRPAEPPAVAAVEPPAVEPPRLRLGPVEAAPTVAAESKEPQVRGIGGGWRAEETAAPPPPAAAEPLDLLAAAKICTELGRVEDITQVLPLLGDAAKLLGARGLIVWVWDGAAGELKPALVHGYSAKVRARLRGVKATADNVTAAAYRAGAPLGRSGALAVPLLAPSACAGVLAVEVNNGREQDAELRALVTFFAAMLAQLVGAPAGEARDAEPEPARPLAAQPG